MRFMVFLWYSAGGARQWLFFFTPCRGAALCAGRHWPDNFFIPTMATKSLCSHRRDARWYSKDGWLHAALRAALRHNIPGHQWHDKASDINCTLEEMPGVSRDFQFPTRPFPTLNLAAQFLQPISRQDMASLPIRRYEGEVVLVNTVREADRALSELLKERVVGFDTETRPAFIRGQSYLPCLAQVATSRTVYLFRLQQVDVSIHLGELFAAGDTAKVGVALADDLRQLRQLFAFDAHRLIDPGVVARGHGLTQTGLRNLAGIFLGFRIPKGARTSNWAAARLSPAQINYAATDAWACRELYLRFEQLGLLDAQAAA